MQTDNGRLEQVPEISVEEAMSAKQQELLEQSQNNPDLVFSVGEHVKIKDGDFKIISLGKRRMILEGLPGNRIKKS